MVHPRGLKARRLASRGRRTSVKRVIGHRGGPRFFEAGSRKKSGRVQIKHGLLLVHSWSYEYAKSLKYISFFHF